MNNILSDFCFSTLNSTGETIILKRGEKGYFIQDKFKNSNAQELNEQIGVTPVQEKAMKMGSMYGWDVPGANPDNYDENGKLKEKIFE